MNTRLTEADKRPDLLTEREARIRAIAIALTGQPPFPPSQVNRRKGKRKHRGGAAYHKPTGKWQAYRYVGKRKISLGYHATKEAALSAASQSRAAANNKKGTVAA